MEMWSAARKALEIFGAADELRPEGRWRYGGCGRRLEPEAALEPPMAEELGVKGSADGWGALEPETLASSGVADEVGEVGGVALDASGRPLRK